MLQSFSSLDESQSTWRVAAQHKRTQRCGGGETNRGRIYKAIAWEGQADEDRVRRLGVHGLDGWSQTLWWNGRKPWVCSTSLKAASAPLSIGASRRPPAALSQ